MYLPFQGRSLLRNFQKPVSPSTGKESVHWKKVRMHGMYSTPVFSMQLPSPFSQTKTKKCELFAEFFLYIFLESQNFAESDFENATPPCLIILSGRRATPTTGTWRASAAKEDPHTIR